MKPYIQKALAAVHKNILDCSAALLCVAAIALSVVALTSCSSDNNDDKVTCSAKDNNNTHYCSEGIFKEYGSVTIGDKAYKTVEIGEQTWMAENLSYKTETGSYCYSEDNDETYVYDFDIGDYVLVTVTPELLADNCAKYGRLYEHETATTVCPSGWHLPSNADWNKLVNYVGDSLTAGTKLRAIKGWNSIEFVEDEFEDEEDEEREPEKVIKEGGNGTDDYGFSALPGSCNTFEVPDPWGSCLIADFGGYWWSSDDYINNYVPAAYYQGIAFFEATYLDYRSKGFGMSVRCVKD